MSIATQPSVAFDHALCHARRTLYRFAALSLLDPRVESRLSALAEQKHLLNEAAALVREEPAAEVDELALGERPLSALDPATVLSRLPSTPEELNACYEQTFGLLVSSTCPPYETEYIPDKFVFQRSNGLADIAGFYRAFGMELSAAHPERPDHIALELEFMACLLELEAHATEHDGPEWAERRTICRDAQARFLREHLAWWAPAFTRLLARHNPEGYYAAAGEFVAALIAAERGLLQVPTPRGRAEPSLLERPEECDGCELAANVFSQ